MDACLKREDAARLGYDSGKQWMELLRSKRAMFCKQMKIDSENLRWYAAFHNESYHPHVHVMVYSAKDHDGFLTEPAIEAMRSELAHDIFRQDFANLYGVQNAAREGLKKEAEQTVKRLIQEIQSGTCQNQKIEKQIHLLSKRLQRTNGKKVYGYLKADLKQMVDRIVDEMERLPSVRDCYDQWLILQGKVDGYYHDKPRERKRLSQEKAFRQIKNAVIKEAENIRQCNLFFEDKGVEQESEPEEFRNASYDYETLRDVIRDESLTLEERSDAVSELETLAKSGDKYAQYILGKLYLMGQGVEYDKELGAYWLSKAAEQGNVYAEALLQHQNRGRPPHVFLSVTHLLHHMSRIFQERSLPQSGTGLQVDSKLRQKIREKKIAMGHKSDDHEDPELTQGGMGGMIGY